jgi:hypothetical protein
LKAPLKTMKIIVNKRIEFFIIILDAEMMRDRYGGERNEEE